MTDTTTHGGKRPGAGRKPLPEGEKQIKALITLPPNTLAKAKSNARKKLTSLSAYIASLINGD